MAALSCEFFHGGCGHDAIFASEYKRTNRTKRTKILRCFPHCCPEHVNRSYCGSAVNIQVQSHSGGESGGSWLRNRGDMLVFAHFEEARADCLVVGSEIAFDTIASAIQTEQTPKGVWIEGTLMQSDMEQNLLIYQINAGARWYYEWESAATKAQRFTKHVLRVYVFERMDSFDRGAPRMLRVVALTTSSEFLVVSYRRAPTEGRVERRDVLPLQSSEWQSLTVSDGVDGVAMQTTSDPHTRSIDPNQGLNDSISDRRAPSFTQATITSEAQVDQKLWMALHEDAMRTSKHFAIIHCFLMNVDALQFHSCLRQWGTLLFGQAGVKPHFSWSFLQTAGQGSVPISISPADDDTVQDPTARVVHFCASVVGWLTFDSSTMEHLRHLLRGYAHGLLDKQVLRNGYIAVVELLRSSVDRFAGSSDNSPAPSSTLSQLTEEVLTIVFQNDSMKHLRSAFIELLASQEMFGFEPFVAQIRAMFVAEATRSLMRIPRRVVEQQWVSPFQGTWTFDGNRSLLSSGASATLPLSLECALHFLREWARLSIAVPSDQSIVISSSWADSEQSGMHLVFDGRQRIFRRFPSGLSSMIPLGSQTFGEYRGQVMSPSCFVVEFASFEELSLERSTTNFLWTVQFDVEDVDEDSGVANSMLMQVKLDTIHREEASRSPPTTFYMKFAYSRHM